MGMKIRGRWLPVEIYDIDRVRKGDSEVGLVIWIIYSFHYVCGTRVYVAFAPAQVNLRGIHWGLSRI